MHLCVRIVRHHPSEPTCCRPGPRALRPWLTGLSALAAAAALAAPASAQTTTTSGNVSATIPIFVKVYSVNVSPSSFTFSNCHDNASPANPTAGLYLPNGSCDSSGAPLTVQVTSNIDSHVTVIGAPAAPSDGLGASWNLCDPSGAAAAQCGAGPSTPPGGNQFRMQVGGSSSPVSALNTAGELDTNFAAAGSATPGQFVAESLTITAPSSSTDISPSFTTSVSWLVSA